ncbi:MAG: hypothetical protein LC808_10560, partial [Actinobacteria bacterium]|nr:hypothetical protein [Actinomycetota bacterium]
MAHPFVQRLALHPVHDQVQAPARRPLLARRMHERALERLPDGWVGEALEVQNAPTHAGTISFGLRWERRQPVLRWELHRHPDLTGPVVITAPGLDPS